MNHQKYRMLIIDDDKMLLEMMYLMLTEFASLTVDLAEDAGEGIKYADNNHYDLILTDIIMPGMSGNDICDYVKNNIEQSIPIIAVSGMPWLAEKSSFDAVIAKPFRKNELLTLVRQFISD